MELIKRRILVKKERVWIDDEGNEIGRTPADENLSNGLSSDTFYYETISGDTGTTYNTKILLTNKAVDLGFFDVEPYLDVGGDVNGVINISSNGVGHFYINSNVRWKIRKTVDWIVLDNYDGKNNAKITINLGKYNTHQTRSGEIIISTNIPNMGATITIKQNPLEIG